MSVIIAAAAAALAASIPLVLFLTAAIWLAELAARAGLADAIAHRMIAAARGRMRAVFALVCGACALLTAVLSLDGAVVLMVPVVAALHRRGAPRRPLLLATIGVPNAFSIAVAQGNPTNLVVMAGLHIDTAAFDRAMFLPGVAAAAVCVAVVAVRERGALRGRLPVHARPDPGRGGRAAAGALAAAGAAEALAPALGVSPWWPACAVALGAAVCLRRSAAPLPAPAPPWRLGAAVCALATVLGILAAVSGVAGARLPSASLGALLAVTAGAAALAAVVNNLPASVAAATLLHPGAAAYAVLTGVSVGALAGPRGSVATILVRDLGGTRAWGAVGSGYVRLWLPTAAAAAAAATTLVWLLGAHGGG
jgi:arsenical pump membrane protein